MVQTQKIIPQKPATQSVEDQQTSGVTQPGGVLGEKPFWKKWWFWAIVVGVLGIGVLTYFLFLG